VCFFCARIGEKKRGRQTEKEGKKKRKSLSVTERRSQNKFIGGGGSERVRDESREKRKEKRRRGKCRKRGKARNQKEDERRGERMRKGWGV
jgi:hypothetical protein